MKIHKKLEQRSDDWFEMRKGKLTASNAQSIQANGKGLETYITTLLAEKYSQNKEHFTNADIERGIELEEQARMIYEIEKEKVEDVGFIEMDKFVGCSPDGLVGKDGGLEIKCPNDLNYFKLLVNGESAIDKKYYYQVQMSLLVSGRKWWDLMFYNPNFDKSNILFRIKPEEKSQEKLIAGIEKGKEIMKELEKKYKKLK